MEKYEYRKEAAGYVLLKDGEPLLGPMEEVAIAFDIETGTRHKHGQPALVEKWVKEARDKLRPISPASANALVVLCGAFDVEDLNRCIQCSSYVKSFYEKLMANTSA